jgi:hypothetical protein
VELNFLEAKIRAIISRYEKLAIEGNNKALADAVRSFRKSFTQAASPNAAARLLPK